MPEISPQNGQQFNYLLAIFRLDSSILGQRKKNQKRRDLKLRAQQRRLSEGDSVDYEETRGGTAIKVSWGRKKVEAESC